MPNFYDLPRELRDTIYKELLIYPSSHISMDVYCGEVFCSPDDWSDDEDDYNFDQFLCPAILLANKKTYHEAIALLYSKNQFNFDDSFGTILGRFLAQIGPQNASLLRHIDISFPRHDGVLEEMEGIIALEEDTARVLDLIKDKCTGIQTLETTPISTDYALGDDFGCCIIPEEASEFLTLVATRFEAISSLREVILHVNEEPVDHVKEKISAFGCRHLKITERNAEDESTDGDSLAGEDDSEEDDSAEDDDDADESAEDDDDDAFPPIASDWDA